jgi:hypothetical protein
MGGYLLVLVVWLVCLIAARFWRGRLPLWTGGGWQATLGGLLSGEARARALLRDVLTEAEYEQLTRHGYLEVRSPSIKHRVYRIPGDMGRVSVYDRGKEVMELCLQPVAALPHSDVIVMHKLMIEANEQEYLATANHLRPGRLAEFLRVY